MISQYSGSITRFSINEELSPSHIVLVAHDIKQSKEKQISPYQEQIFIGDITSGSRQRGRGGRESKFKVRLPTIDESKATSLRTLLLIERPMRGIRFPRTESLTSQKFMESLKNISQTSNIAPSNSSSSSSSSSPFLSLSSNNRADSKRNCFTITHATTTTVAATATISKINQPAVTISAFALLEGSLSMHKGDDVLDDDDYDEKGKGNINLSLSHLTSSNKNNKPAAVEVSKMRKAESPLAKRRPSKIEIEERLRKLDASFSSPSSPTSPTESKSSDSFESEIELSLPMISSSNLPNSQGLLPSSMFEKSLASPRKDFKNA